MAYWGEGEVWTPPPKKKKKKKKKTGHQPLFSAKFGGIHWAHFANIQTCNFIFFWGGGGFQQLYQNWKVLDRYWHYPKMVWISIFMDAKPLKLCGKEDDPQRPDMWRGHGNPTSNNLPRSLSENKICNVLGN